MPDTIITMRKNLANYSELLENHQEYFFLSCLRNLRYVYIFRNTTHWKINYSEKRKILKENPSNKMKMKREVFLKL